MICTYLPPQAVRNCCCLISTSNIEPGTSRLYPKSIFTEIRREEDQNRRTDEEEIVPVILGVSKASNKMLSGFKSLCTGKINK